MTKRCDGCRPYPALVVRPVASPRWRIWLFGRGGSVWWDTDRDVRGFHRWMTRLAFGVEWERMSDD